MTPLDSSYLLTAKLKDVVRLMRFEKIRLPRRKSFEPDYLYQGRVVDAFMRAWNMRHAPEEEQRRTGTGYY